MTIEKARVSAVIAGVYAYLQSEKESVEPESGLPPQTFEKVESVAPSTGTLWTASGRIFSMQMRNLMQFRALRKF